MSLSSALSIAQSALRNTSRQTSTVSRNVADASNPDYARRTAVLTSTGPGARVVEIQRATNELLFRQNLSALADFSGQNTLFEGLQKLALDVNGSDNKSSPATVLGKFQQALQLYAASPSNQNLGTAAIDAARQVVRSLNDGTDAIQKIRTEADGEIATAVDDLNTLLADFEQANKLIMTGTRTARDVNDSLDQRDAILKKISEIVPISTFKRGDNDMVITTASGATLFETVPRAVTFEQSPGFAPGMAGSKVYIDGVPIQPGTGANTDAAGKLAGLVQLRDSVANTMQAQLDETARGLITAFSESAPGLANQAGLFTWSGGPAVPPAGTLINGLARQIKINPAVDPTVGGNPKLLRDGGINGASYIANTANNASYADLLISYGNRIDEPMVFDPAAGITANSSLSSFTTNSIGWFEAMRKQADSATQSKEALAVRTAEALSSETAVNVDIEMSLMLDLEHAYQASARLLKAVDEMLSALLAAVR
ncbi:flagellar hook-associated protein FlgK [Aminobacter sp. AP02]|uniref:flagellar hook-associated protein FlgK n=1 Tax=Aminobacter sp. AP02 TaxID=2135737 RepID=UPI000D6CB6C2|nr:flagellar hook-associated protein FlgK [Aminobacter sp. AP02]PWK71657.1 flagellar hook-associated protein 1 FlgK [Aminobacter sp. AP02]